MRGFGIPRPAEPGPGRILVPVLFALSLTVAPSPGAAAFPLPSLQAGLQVEAGDNLLEDSLAWSDQGLGLDLRLLQPVGERLSLLAGGGWTTYADHDELAEGSLQAGLWYSLAAPRLEVFEVRLQASGQRHADGYSLYDQRRTSLQLAARGKPRGGLRPRGQLLLAETRFPSAPDSQRVDAREVGLSFGVNWALDLPLALDLEAGAQGRRWFRLDEPVETMWSWTSLRASRPLGSRWGMRAQVDRRWQGSPSGDQLAMLGEHGLDPADLLWSGWQGELSLQTGWLGWRTGLRGTRLAADFTALPGQEARRETRWEAGVVFSRTVRPAGLPAGWRLGAEVDLSRRWTDSSLTLYDVASTRGRLRLTLTSP
jgi:hypothetical protein